LGQISVYYTRWYLPSSLLVFAGVTPPDGTSVALLKEITRRAPPTSGYFF
jgi:hypothetical protein